MPLHDVGYRSWEGTKTSLLGRWFLVATTGVRLAFRSTWLSRTLILSWVPAIMVGIFFFFFEQSIVNVQYRRLIQGVVLSAGTTSDLAQQVAVDPESARHEAWASMILVFFRYPQAVVMLIVVALVAPRLISTDLRNRGYLLYFSRPIKPLGYIAGKALVIWTFLGLITTLPALVLYVVGLCLSPDVSVIWDTWDLPLRIVAASLALMVPVSAIALACSALTTETRYAAFSWFAFWVVGWVSYSVLRVGELAGSDRGPRRFRRGDRPRRGEFLNEEQIAEATQISDWEIVSPFHTLGRVQQYIFGLFPEDESIVPFIAVLVFVSLGCLWFVRSRILKRLKA